MTIKRKGCPLCGRVAVLVHVNGELGFHFAYRDEEDPTTRFVCPGGAAP